MSDKKPEFSPESSKIIWYALVTLLVATAGLAVLLWGGFLCSTTFIFLALACMIFPVMVIVYAIVQDEGWESLFS